MASFDVVVVGGGAIGASILHGLARRGLRRTLLLDGGPFAGGTTGKSAAMVRVYHRSPALADLALEGLIHYQRFGREVGDACGFRRTGSLYFEPATRLQEVHLEVQRLRRRGHRLEILDRKAGERRFPGVAWPERALAVHEPEAGFADPVRTTRAWIQGAVALGAQAREGVRVRELIRKAGRVAGVVADGGAVEARLVILAAGLGAKDLLPLPLEERAIRVHRYLRAAPGSGHPIFFDPATRAYGRPDGENGSLVGTGSVAATAPDRPEQTRALAGARLRDLGRHAGTVEAREAYTADRRGLFGTLPDTPGLLVAVGWSGTGFKSAPAVGRRAAELARRLLA